MINSFSLISSKCLGSISNILGRRNYYINYFDREYYYIFVFYKITLRRILYSIALSYRGNNLVSYDIKAIVLHPMSDGRCNITMQYPAFYFKSLKTTAITALAMKNILIFRSRDRVWRQWYTQLLCHIRNFHMEIAIARTCHLPDTLTRPNQPSASHRFRWKSVGRMYEESTEQRNCPCVCLPYGTTGKFVERDSHSTEEYRGKYSRSIIEKERTRGYFGCNLVLSSWTRGRVDDLVRKIKGWDYFLLLFHSDRPGIIYHVYLLLFISRIM